MVFQRTDDELQNWLRWELENGSSPLRAIAEAALVADLKHYNLLRPVRLGLKDGESRSANSSTVLDRELEQEKSRDPSGTRIRCPLCGWSPRKEDKSLSGPPARECGEKSTSFRPCFLKSPGRSPVTYGSPPTDR